MGGHCSPILNLEHNLSYFGCGSNGGMLFELYFGALTSTVEVTSVVGVTSFDGAASLGGILFACSDAVPLIRILVI